MSGKIFNFEAARRAKNAPKTTALQINPKTDHEIFVTAYEEIIDEWRTQAAKNTLNEYIKKKIPAFTRGADDADFVNDLNVLAHVEDKLDMKVLVFSPTTSHSNPYGWLVGFHYNKEVYSAPPIMVSEQYGRALNILLFVEFTSQLRKLKRL